MISVIVPVYNVATYLTECLESIAQQTYTDMEVIIIDDGSIDNTGDIASDFVEHYIGPIQFKILSHQQNRGLSAARNTGLKASSGDYVSFIDGDDYVASNMFERLITVMDTKGPDVGIVCCCLYMFDDERKWKALYSCESEETIPYNEFIEKMLLWEAPHMACCKLYKSTIFEGALFREGCTNEDVLFNFDIYPYIEDNKITTIVIPDRLYFYRQHSNSICHSSKKYFFLTEMKNSVMILSSFKKSRLCLYRRLETVFLNRIMSELKKIIKQDSLYHQYYLDCCRLLKTIPTIDAYHILPFPFFRIYLYMKYAPRIYRSVRQ